MWLLVIVTVFLAVITKAGHGLNITSRTQSRRTLSLHGATYEHYTIELYDEFENDETIESLFFDSGLWDETNRMFTEENEIITQKCVTYHGDTCLCHVRGETEIYYCSTVESDKNFFYYSNEYVEWGPKEDMADPDVFAKMVDSAVSATTKKEPKPENVKARDFIVKYFKEKRMTGDEFRKMGKKARTKAVQKAANPLKIKIPIGVYLRLHAAIEKDIETLLNPKPKPKVFPQLFPEFKIKVEMGFHAALRRSTAGKFEIGNHLEIKYDLADNAAKTWEEMSKFSCANMRDSILFPGPMSDQMECYKSWIPQFEEYKTKYAKYLKAESKYKLTLAEYLIIRDYTSTNHFCYLFRMIWRQDKNFDISPMQHMLSAFWRALHKPERIADILKFTRTGGTNLFHGTHANIKEFMSDFETFNKRKEKKIEEIENLLRELTDVQLKEATEKRLRKVKSDYQKFEGPLSTTAKSGTALSFGPPVFRFMTKTSPCKKLLRNKPTKKENEIGFLPESEILLIGQFGGAEAENIWMGMPSACFKVFYNEEGIRP